MLAWIIEPAISLSLFYLAYIIFLKKVAFFRANRYYLLTAILFSLILPHINFSPPVTITNYSYIIPEVTITENPRPQILQASGTSWTLSRVLMFIYIFAAALLSARLVFRLFQVYFLVAGNRTRKYNNAFIVSLDSDQSPFSFLNYIFINEALYGEEEKQKILEHELAHISQYHTFDLFILEFLTIIQWFNPVSWLYRRSVLEIHEYLADEEVLKKGTSIPFYQSLLLNLQMGSGYISPASNFNKALTLNRIKMMTTIRPASRKMIRFFILVPALVLLVLMCTKAEDQKPEVTDAGPSAITPPSAARDETPASETAASAENEIFFIVEDMPDFQGKGADGFREYISENVRYPQVAIENGTQGRVFVQFVVNDDGSVSDAKIARGVDPSLDEEALRVVMASPKWEPGRQRGEAVNVAFTFPINFTLQ